ncbi:MAG: hypothetical protein AAGA29_07510 [Planctomycetota bacterium]
MKRAAQKFDPKQEAFARELKDRWLEQVLAQPALLAPSRERYAVSRQIEATKPMERVVEPAREGEARRLDAA